MPGIDYSKFDKIEDSDEEEDYNGYLRKRYGVTSGWQPGCGMQQPILGGRTPGQAYEECELEPLGEVEFPAASREEPTGKAGGRESAQVTESTGGLGRCARSFFGAVRLLQVCAWLMQLLMAALHIGLQHYAAEASRYRSNVEADLLAYSDGSSNLRLEAVVYPVVLTNCLVIGFFDVCIAFVARTRAEGPAAVAFMCWLKRVLLGFSFLAYEAQYPSAGGLLGGVPLRPVSGMLMIFAWSLRKTLGYSKDLLALASNSQLVGARPTALETEYKIPVPVPGGPAILVFEALTELVFLVVHLALMASGIRFFGYKQPVAIWACTLGIAFAGNFLVIRMACTARNAQTLATKEEHVE